MARTGAGEQARSRLVAAAVQQLAAEGMRGLTHRKVEQRAQMAQGSAKYHFGSLDGLVEAVLQHMVDVEIADVLDVSAPEMEAAKQAGRMPEAVFDMARASMSRMMARPDLLRARYALFLHAADKPELQAIIRRGRDAFVTAIAATLPSEDPELGARLVMATVDGMLLHQLSAPDQRLGETAPGLMLLVAAAAAQLPPPGTPLPGGAAPGESLGSPGA